MGSLIEGRLETNIYFNQHPKSEDGSFPQYHFLLLYLLISNKNGASKRYCVVSDV